MEKAKPIHQEATGIPQQSAESAFQLPPNALTADIQAPKAEPTPGKITIEERQPPIGFEASTGSMPRAHGADAPGTTAHPTQDIPAADKTSSDNDRRENTVAALQKDRIVGQYFTDRPEAAHDIIPFASYTEKKGEAPHKEPLPGVYVVPNEQSAKDFAVEATQSVLQQEDARLVLEVGPGKPYGSTFAMSCAETEPPNSLILAADKSLGDIPRLEKGIKRDRIGTFSPKPGNKVFYLPLPLDSYKAGLAQRGLPMEVIDKAYFLAPDPLDDRSDYNPSVYEALNLLKVGGEAVIAPMEFAHVQGVRTLQDKLEADGRFSITPHTITGPDDYKKLGLFRRDTDSMLMFHLNFLNYKSEPQTLKAFFLRRIK